MLHYLALYVLSIIIYFFITATKFIRQSRKRGRYDYWTSGYLFDSERPIKVRILLFLCYTGSIFILLFIYEKYQGLYIPLFD